MTREKVELCVMIQPRTNKIHSAFQPEKSEQQPIVYQKTLEIAESNQFGSQWWKNQMVGLPGFEPESIEPKSTSLDQASRQPL